MSTGAFLLFLACCAAVFALWIDVRAPRLTPSTLRATLLRVVLALIVLELAAPVAGRVVMAEPQNGAIVASLFVVLPVLTYFFLAAIWTIKALQGLMYRF